MMKFLLLIHGDADAEAALTDAERRALVDQHIAFGRTLRGRGTTVSGEALEPPERARTIRFAGDGVTVTDGPFLEAKEALGGFYVIEAASMDDATDIAKGLPRSPGAFAEILPIADV
jgi:hypothetical protein